MEKESKFDDAFEEKGRFLKGKIFMILSHYAMRYIPSNEAENLVDEAFKEIENSVDKTLDKLKSDLLEAITESVSIDSTYKGAE